MWEGSGKKRLASLTFRGKTFQKSYRGYIKLDIPSYLIDAKFVLVPSQVTVFILIPCSSHRSSAREVKHFKFSTFRPLIKAYPIGYFQLRRRLTTIYTNASVATSWNIVTTCFQHPRCETNDLLSYVPVLLVLKRHNSYGVIDVKNFLTLTNLKRYSNYSLFSIRPDKMNSLFPIT